MRVLRPCIERLPDGRGCPAEPGKSRCAECQAAAIVRREISGDTTPEWRRVRRIALERTGHRCERRGRSGAQGRAEGHGGLNVHHVDGRGVRAREHHQAMLDVRCPPCPRLTMKRGTRPSSASRRRRGRERVGAQQRG